MGNDVQNWRGVLRAEASGGWSRWLSFAAVWLWCCLEMRTELFSLTSIASDIYFPNDFIVLAGSVAALVVLVLISGRLRSVLDSVPWLATATACFVIGSFCILVGCEEGLLVPDIIGLVSSGIAIGILKIAWGEMFSRMPLQRGLICMGIALVTSSFAFIVCELLPEEVVRVLLVLCAMSCAPLLRHGSACLSTSTGPLATGSTRVKHINPSWKFLILPILVAFTFGITRIRYLPGVQTTTASMALVASELLTGLLLLLFSRCLTKEFGAAQIYGFGLLFVVFGYLMLAFQIGPVWLGYAVHNLGFTMFYFFMIVFWGSLAARMNYPIVKVYAIGYFAFQSMNLLGSSSEIWLLSENLTVASYLTSVLLLVGFFIAVLFIFGDSRSPVHLWLTGEEDYETSDRISETCAAVARKYDLTAREYEVLIILARGRNASYTARSLGIAYDTAKVHIKNIYTKLDIHNQQDLLDLIDETMP